MKNALKRTILFALSILISLVLVELGLYFFQTEGRVGVTYEVTRDLKIKRPYNTSKIWQHPDFKSSHEVRYNNFGLRGPDISPNPPSGVKRILLIGDSHIEDPYVGEAYQFATVLQKLLDIVSPGSFEVVNAGLWASSAVEQYLFLKQLLKEIKVDLVIQQYCPNDPEDISSGKLVELSGDMLIFNNPKKSIFDFFKQFNFYHFFQLKISHNVRNQNLWEVDDLNDDLHKEQVSESSQRILKIYKETMRLTRDLTNQYGAQLIEILLPLPRQFELKRYFSDRHFRRITEIHKELNIQSINCRPDISHSLKDTPFFDSRKKFYFLSDPHLNELGILWLSGLLLKYIVSKGDLSQLNLEEIHFFKNSYRPLIKKYSKVDYQLHTVDQLRYAFRVSSPEIFWFVDELDEFSLIKYNHRLQDGTSQVSANLLDYDSLHEDISLHEVEMYFRLQETLLNKKVFEKYDRLFNENGWERVFAGGSKSAENLTETLYLKRDGQVVHQAVVKYFPGKKLTYVHFVDKLKEEVGD